MMLIILVLLHTCTCYLFCNRTASINTILSHSVSLSELSLSDSQDTTEEDNSSLLSRSLSALSFNRSRLVEESDTVSHRSIAYSRDDTFAVEDSGVDVNKGGYLGRFFSDSNGKYVSYNTS